MTGQQAQPRFKIKPFRRVVQTLVFAVLIAVPHSSRNPVEWAPSRIIQGQIPAPATFNIFGDTWNFEINGLQFAHPLSFVDTWLSAQIIYLPLLVAAIIPLALILGSLLFPMRGQILLGLGNSVAVLLVFLVAPNLNMPDAVRVCGIFVVTSVLLIIGTQFRDALERKRLDELRAVNLELQAMQATLEQRVTERTQNAVSAGQAAEHARQLAEIARQAMEEQVWISNGQVKLNQAIHGEQDLPTLAENITRLLCQYLDAQVGALYLRQEDWLELAGGYAYTPGESAAQRFEIGEGLVGEAAAQKRPSY